MKKISFYAILAMGGLLMASCDESFNDWAEPQTNPQEEAITIPNLTATALAETVDLEVANDQVKLLSLSEAALPEGMTLQNLTLVPVVDEAERLDLAVKGLDVEGNFSKADLQNMVKAIYGKKRLERAVSGNIYLNGQLGSQAMLIKAGTVALSLMPEDPGYENYYLVGTPNGWNNDTKGTYMIPVEKGVYSFTTSYSGAWDVKFIAEDNLGSWDVLWGGADGDNSESGSLFTDNAGALSSPEAGFYTFTADMNNSTYTWTKLEDQEPTEYTVIGLIGGFNGWGGDVEMEQAAPHFWYVETTIDEETELKFRADNGWDVNWGKKITISDSAFYGVGEPGGDNIKVPAGKYAFYLNDITGEFAIIAQ